MLDVSVHAKPYGTQLDVTAYHSGSVAGAFHIYIKQKDDLLADFTIFSNDDLLASKITQAINQIAVENNMRYAA